MNIFPLILESIAIGDELRNPQKGTSIIVGINSSSITYQRKNTRIRLKMGVVNEIFEKFHGKRLSTEDLRRHSPQIFGQNGHPCNSTFILMLFERIGLVEEKIHGGGSKADPFFIFLKLK